MSILPKFTGKPLGKTQVDFLRDDFGEAVFEEYQKRVRTDFDGVCSVESSNLNVFEYERGILRGSNPFTGVLVNQIIEPEGLRVATPADLEKIIRTHALDIGDCEIDLGLVFSTFTYSLNHISLANCLVLEMVKKSKVAFNLPLVIPLLSLKLEKYSGSEYYGAVFTLKDNPEIIPAPGLKAGHFSSEDVDEKTGLPKQTGKKGSRYLLISRNEYGFSRLILHGPSHSLNTRKNLATSYLGGRIVIVCDG